MGSPRFLASRFALLSCCLCLFAPGSQLLAQSAATSAQDTRITSLLDSLRKVRAPQTAAISPDGNSVAWTINGPAGSELHLTSVAPPQAPQAAGSDRILSPDTSGNAANLQPGVCPAAHPAWSPDGKQLAFLSGCELHDASFRKSSQNNLFVWIKASNQIQQLTQLKGELASLSWSPDGTAVGFLFVENATRRAGALDAMKPWSGVVGEEGVEIQRAAAVGVASHTFWYLTPPGLHVYEFSWAPGSEQIAFVAAMPPGENNWWVAQLYTRDVQLPWRAKGQPCPGNSDCLRLTAILNPQAVSGPLHGLQLAVPRFSPDGRQIAFIGGLMSDQGSTGGDIYLVPVAGGEPRNLTPGRTASPAWLAWRNDHSLLVTERASGKSHITAIDLTTHKDDPATDVTLPDNIIAGSEVMDLSLAAHSPEIAVIRSSFEHPPEVWTGPVNNLRQLTHINDAARPSWGRSESIEYTSDGFHVQGWLLYPANYDPARRYPLIVNVHGGPSGGITPHWPAAGYGAVPFSTLGYFVFMPDPRGSFGEGEAFTRANIKDFGYGDLRDILAGMDILEKRLPIDRQREGITGWSYGGFMTMFAVTQTTRFKAAVAGAGISNWQSYYGENSIDQWMVPFFGATVYDDPAVYARSSPIQYIRQAKTPTLVVVGDRDGECPAPQSFEFWHALRAEGIKTQLVVYPNEGHHFVDPEHQRDVLARALQWFETQMPPSGE